MKFAMRVISVLAGIAVVIPGLAACSNSSAAVQQPTVRIATGVDPSYSQIFLAKAEGIFEKHGVNVEYITTEGGPAPTQMIIAGQAEFAMNADATALPLLGPNPNLRALTILQESGTYVKAVFRQGVDSADQIKKMGVVTGLAALSTVRFLESKGIKRGDVEFVSATPPDLPTLLQRGDIDAYVVYEPWASRGEASGGHIVGSIKDFGLNYAQWLMVDATWLSANEETAAKVVAAISEANELVESDPSHAAGVTEKAVKVPTELSKQLMGELTFRTRDFTDEDLKVARSTAQFFVDEGKSTKLPNFDKQILKGWLSAHAN